MSNTLSNLLKKGVYSLLEISQNWGYGIKLITPLLPTSANVTQAWWEAGTPIIVLITVPSMQGWGGGVCVWGERLFM